MKQGENLNYILEVLKDSILWNEAHFSTIKFTQGEQLIELKEGDLDGGRAIFAESESDATYRVHISKKRGLITKEGTFIGAHINFYTNYPSSIKFNADSLVALIKRYETEDVMDITVNASDTTFTGSFQSYTPAKRIWGKDYKKKLSADILVYYHKSGEDGSTTYKTRNGDKFKIKVLETRPVIVDDYGSNGIFSSKGYMLKLLIPEVTLTKIVMGHYHAYRNESITLKNMELRVLILSPR